MPKLLLAEHEYQVQDLLRRGLGLHSRWIALGPSAMACLERLGVEYQIPEEFYAEDEFEEFCEHTHRQVEFLCDRLDECLLEHHVELKTRGMRPFRFNIFPLFMIFDGVRGRTFQLQKIFQAYPEHTIHIHKGKSDRPGALGLLFTNQETLWGHVASLPGWQAKVELVAEPEQPVRSTGSKRNLSALLKTRILKSLVLTTAARLLTQQDYRGLIRLLNKDREALLFVNAPYEWTYLLPGLQAEGRRILFVSEYCFESKTNDGPAEFPAKTFEAPESDSDLMNCLEWGGVCFYSLLKDRLSSIWHNGPGQFEWIAGMMKRLKQRHKISTLLRCSSVSGIDHAINQSARSLGMPVLAWQHGAVSYYDQITQFHDYADSMTADYTLVYGREVEKAYTEFGRQFSAKVISTGAPSLDWMISDSQSPEKAKPNLKSNGSKKRVLYATTNYMQNHWYSGWTPPFSDRLFFQDQSVIISGLRLLAESEAVEIVVKLHPSYDYQDPPWVSELSTVRNIRMVRDEESFTNLLNQTEVSVLDFPSTTLLQSLATGLPVFVLTRHLRYPRETQAMLSRRAFVAENAQALIGGLQKFLDSGEYSANLKDTLFLEGYGTHLNDGKSGERAFELVSRVMGNGLRD